MKQKLQSAMRTLRKSINKQQFYIQFSGTEYEVAQKPSRAPEGTDTCSTGQVLKDGKCGEFWWLVLARKMAASENVADSVLVLSELWRGDVLQRRAGPVCPVSSWDLSGHRGSAGL